MHDRNDFFGKQLDRLRGQARGVNIDDISEVSAGPQDIECDPPSLNEGAPLQVVTDLPEPIPVRIVAQDRGDYVRRNSQTFNVGVKARNIMPPINVLGKQFNRQRLVLVNPEPTVAGKTIYIGTSSESATDLAGFPLLPQKDITLYGFDDWYASLATGVAADIVLMGVLVDYEWDI